MKRKYRLLQKGLVTVTALLLSASPVLAATKNVILMISDGQGFNTITATNYYTGIKPAYEPFPVKLGMQTYSAGKRGGYVGKSYDPSKMVADFTYAMTGATDSASAATAMYTGVKVYDNEVNYTPDNQTLETFFEKAAKAGKSIGAVSTVQFTHATPVAVYGHNKSRNNYSEMALEAVYGGNPNTNNNFNDAGNYNGNLKVVMGTGHPLFDTNGQSQTANYGYVGGESAWNDLAAGVNGWTKVDTLAGFLKLMCGHTPDKVFGVAPNISTLQFDRDGKGDPNDKSRPYDDPLLKKTPNLTVMTKAALNVLDNNPKGFAVIIEGGAIDWANHADLAGRMIEEQIDFNAAVREVVRYLDNNTHGNNWKNTLLIVTADHECGYLWGDGREAGSTYFDVDRDGEFDHGVDYAHVKNNGVGKLPTVWYHSTNHSNSLVPLYAKGAGSELFKMRGRIVGIEPNLRAIYNLNKSWSGQYIDNTAIFQVMSAAVLQ